MDENGWNVQLFIQRLLNEKYILEDETQKFGVNSTSKLVNTVNSKINDIGFSLIKIFFEGKYYYTLKNIMDRSLSVVENDKISSFTKVLGCQFTMSQIQIFSDSIKMMISEGLPISSDRSIRPCWYSICVNNGLSDISQQEILLDRLIKNAWLSIGYNDSDIIPGIRFYADLSESFPMDTLPYCGYCQTPIIIYKSICSRCNKTFHKLCNKTGICIICTQN